MRRDWNQGWQDFVIGLGLSFALVEAISAGILAWHTPPAQAPGSPTALVIVAQIVARVLPLALGYGIYAALIGWTVAARDALRLAGCTRSPYTIGSVVIFWVTMLGLLASNVFRSDAHNVQVTGAILRMCIGIAGAWLAVFVRQDLDALIAAAKMSDAVVVPAP